MPMDESVPTSAEGRSRPTPERRQELRTGVVDRLDVPYDRFLLGIWATEING
jgi:hypothetical protein